MAKLTLSLEISPSDLLTLFALLRQRDESGGRPASPFSGGFRMRGPFNLEDLFETLARETGEGGPEEGYTGLEERLGWLFTDFELLKDRQKGGPEREPEAAEHGGNNGDTSGDSDNGDV
jgi:hypothetical protein